MHVYEPGRAVTINPDVLKELRVRELRLVQLLCDGMTVPEVAIRANLSYDTVKSLKKRVYKKLGIHHDRELVLWAIEHGMTTVEKLLEGPI